MPDVHTHGHHDPVLRSHRWPTAESSAARPIPRLRAGMTHLDVGCGPGSFTVDLAARVAPGTADPPGLCVAIHGEPVVRL